MDSDIEVLLYIAGNLFRIYVIYSFFQLFFDKNKFSKRITVSAFFIYFLLNSAAFLCFNSPFINLSTNLIITFLLTYFYVASLRTRLLAIVMIYAVNLICEAIVYRALIAFMGKNNVPIGIIVPNLILLPLVLSFEKLMDLKSGQKVSFSEWGCVLLVPLISIYIATVVFDDYPDNKMAAAAATVGLLIINVLIFHLLDHVGAMYRQRYELALQKKQNEAYENQFNIQKEADQRVAVFRHDIKNHIIALRGLVEAKDRAGLLSYINNMDAFVWSSKQFVQSGNLVVDSILNVKLRQADQLGADISIDVSLPEQLGISALDLNMILGNLLDNAIRALSSALTKKISVAVAYERSILYISIMNTYLDRVKILDGRLITTKSDRLGHGIGLRSVEMIAAKYNGDIDIEIKEELFSVTVLLYPEEITKA